jgi:hypothetical protein
MKALQVASEVCKHRKPLLFRETPDGGYETKALAMVKHMAEIERGWSLLDLFTARAIFQVNLILDEAKRQRFESFGLMAMSRAAIRLVVRAETHARACTR